MPGIDGVNTFLLGFGLQFFHQPFGDTVHTADGGYNPYLITDTHLTVLANISLKVSILILNIKRLVYRLIYVFKRA